MKELSELKQEIKQKKINKENLLKYIVMFSVVSSNLKQ